MDDVTVKVDGKVAHIPATWSSPDVGGRYVMADVGSGPG